MEVPGSDSTDAEPFGSGAFDGLFEGDELDARDGADSAETVCDVPRRRRRKGKRREDDGQEPGGLDTPSEVRNGRRNGPKPSLDSKSYLEKLKNVFGFRDSGTVRNRWPVFLALIALVVTLCALVFLFFPGRLPDHSFQSHFRLSHRNPFDKLSAELLEHELDSPAYHIPPAWHPVLSDSPHVALIFGRRGSGKSTLRIVAEQRIRKRNGTVLVIDITPEGQSLNTFLPVLKTALYKDAKFWERALYTEDDYWKIQFPNRFRLDDFVDMILGRGVTLLVDRLVASHPPPNSTWSQFIDFASGRILIPPLGLSTSSAYELARFAGDYYMGTTDALRSLLSMVDRDIGYAWGYKRFWRFLKRNLAFWSGASEGFGEGSGIVLVGIVLAVVRVDILLFDPFQLRRIPHLKERWALSAFLWTIWTLWFLWRRKFSFFLSLSGLLGNLGSVVRYFIRTTRTGATPAAPPPPSFAPQEDGYIPRVIPPSASRTALAAPYTAECIQRNIRWESSISRLKSFRRLASQLGFERVVILLDGVEETPLSDPLENPGVVTAFASTVLSHPLFEITMDPSPVKQTSFLMFFPVPLADVASDEVIERGRLDKYTVLDIGWTAAGLVEILRTRFEAYARGGRGFDELFCGTGWLLSRIEETDWIKTPRDATRAMQRVVAFLEAEWAAGKRCVGKGEWKEVVGGRPIVSL